MINWDNPWDLTSTKFKEVAEALPKKKSERANRTQALSADRVSYSIGKSGAGFSGGGKMSLFNGELRVESIGVVVKGDKAINIYFIIGENFGQNSRKVTSIEVEKLKAELARVSGDNAPKPYDQDVGGGHPPVPGLQWIHRSYKVRMYEVPMFSTAGSRSGTGVFNIIILSLAER